MLYPKRHDKEENRRIFFIVIAYTVYMGLVLGASANYGQSRMISTEAPYKVVFFSDLFYLMAFMTVQFGLLTSILIYHLKKTKPPLNRALLGILLPLLLTTGCFYSTLYLHTKKVIITDKSFQMETLFESKKILWDENKVVNYGLFTATQYGNKASITFKDNSGMTTHFNLRYIRNLNLLEEEIEKHTDFP